MSIVTRELDALRRHPEEEQDRIAATVIVALAEQCILRGNLPEAQRESIQRILALGETIKRGH